MKEARIGWFYFAACAAWLLITRALILEASYGERSGYDMKG